VKRRRIWSEHVTFVDATASSVLRALSLADVQPLLAVFPRTRDTARDLVGACRDAGVSVGLWPMIEDDAGRWASAHNGVAYADFVRRLLDDLGGVLPDTLAIDLEPPIADVRRLVNADPRPLLRRVVTPYPEGGARALVTLVDEVNALGVETLAALVPPLGTGWGRGEGFEHAFGSPLSRLRIKRAGPMTYTSLFTGYGRGVIRRRDARSLLAMLARDTRRTLGERAVLSLGTVGTGALGDERIYEGTAELAEDVAIASAAGIEDLALFDLGGILRRPPVERWLEAFTETGPFEGAVQHSKRARVIRAAVRALGLVLNGLASSARFDIRRDRR
jgi:hypothetical protein